MRTTFGVLVGFALLLAGCGGGDGREVRRVQEPADPFEEFCRQNAGACDEPAANDPVTTPAVTGRGWRKRDCPRRVLDPGPRAPENVVRTMRAAIPRLLSVSSYGHESTLVPENTQVLDIRPLSSHEVNLPGIATLRVFSGYYERAARRLCGRTVASRSWGAILQFGQAASVSLSYRVLFLARTPGGWRAWYPRPEG